MSKYKVEYRNCICTDVQWGTYCVFTIQYKGRTFSYRPPDKYERVLSDEKSIQLAIDGFLKAIKEYGEKHLFDVLNTLSTRIGYYQELLIDADNDSALIFNAKIDELRSIYQELIRIGWSN